MDKTKSSGHYSLRDGRYPITPSLLQLQPPLLKQFTSTLPFHTYMFPETISMLFRTSSDTKYLKMDMIFQRLIMRDIKYIGELLVPHYQVTRCTYFLIYNCMILSQWTNLHWCTISLWPTHKCWSKEPWLEIQIDATFQYSDIFGKTFIHRKLQNPFCLGLTSCQEILLSSITILSI